ncbi:lecithin retinol acyltransferase family protein [Shewanella indica]|uniref:lecithin retinol acyltransferase family protein n=1 Tax=Shewanella indica TaxID=768528 RepID=UPI001BF00EEF|nr:lecithin retinol acyltransferase family protein [Shewanella indica]BCV36056.1 acyltransferase [Shewanella chilikensis]
MKKFKAGDHLVTNIDPLGLTEHHGLCVGNDQVIHQRKDGFVERLSLSEFSGGAKVRRKAIAYDRDGAVERAKSLLGYRPYHLLSNNCEHFVNWCIDETETSNQVSNNLHFTAQVTARAGLLGSAAQRAAQGSLANIALASTAAKAVGEYIGLPDAVNRAIGTPGDLVAKPLETFINGTCETLSTSSGHLRTGNYSEAATSLVKGSLETAVDCTIVKPLEVTGDGIVAIVDIGKDIWLWLKY